MLRAMPLGASVGIIHVVISAALFPCTMAGTLPASSFLLSLNNRYDDVLVQRRSSGRVYAECRVDSAGVFIFKWATGQGTCVGGTQPDTVFPGSAEVSEEYGNRSVLLVAVSNLSAAMDYYVKCVAISDLTRTVVCQRFRVFDYYPAPEVVVAAEYNKIRLSCGTAVLPVDVGVSVVWSLDDNSLLLLNESMAPLSGSSALSTYNASSEIVLEDTMSAGGTYVCTATHPKYGSLFGQQVAYHKKPLAVMKNLTEKYDPQQNRTVVTILCEAYGYPVPAVRLFRGEFLYPGKGLLLPIRGGVNVSFVFCQSRPDRRWELREYGCEAQSASGQSVAYYQLPAKENVSSTATDSTGSSAELPSESAGKVSTEIAASRLGESTTASSSIASASSKDGALNRSTVQHPLGVLVHVVAFLPLMSLWS